MGSRNVIHMGLAGAGRHFPHASTTDAPAQIPAQSIGPHSRTAVAGGSRRNRKLWHAEQSVGTDCKRAKDWGVETRESDAGT
jgi:hypothetical protein